MVADNDQQLAFLKSFTQAFVDNEDIEIGNKLTVMLRILSLSYISNDRTKETYLNDCSMAWDDNKRIREK
jgi:hypothetical protein